MKDNMKIIVYEGIPDCAKAIRQKVFIDEQGFCNEFDDIDQIAMHLVMFSDEERPIATCRIFWDDTMKMYILGRLAVLQEYRGKRIGSMMVQEGERIIQNKGGRRMALHAQCKAKAFYHKIGFIEFGSIDTDEGCPHIWMKKIF